MFVGARSRFRMSFRGSIRRAFAAGRQGSHRPGQRPRGAAGLPPLLSGARVSLPSAYSIRRSFSSLRLRGASVPVCASAPASPQVRAPPRSPSSLYPRADRPRSSAGAPRKRRSGAAREPREVCTEQTICYFNFNRNHLRVISAWPGCTARSRAPFLRVTENEQLSFFLSPSVFASLFHGQRRPTRRLGVGDSSARRTLERARFDDKVTERSSFRGDDKETRTNNVRACSDCERTRIEPNHFECPSRLSVNHFYIGLDFLGSTRYAQVSPSGFFFQFSNASFCSPETFDFVRFRVFNNEKARGWAFLEIVSMQCVEEPGLVGFLFFEPFSGMLILWISSLIS